ncbi:hypothetical protein J6590_033646 [Homalodisca vitripennis]|nr:hypothetical protein J6590_033646 [Homalodisca vitripennis]
MSRWTWDCFHPTHLSCSGRNSVRYRERWAGTTVLWGVLFIPNPEEVGPRRASAIRARRESLGSAQLVQQPCVKLCQPQPDTADVTYQSTISSQLSRSHMEPSLHNFVNGHNRAIVDWFLFRPNWVCTVDTIETRE